MTNGAAIGYAIIAAKQMGIIGDKLVQLEGLMREAMDEYTEDEAEKEYQNT